jgi:hypothetical protein
MAQATGDTAAKATYGFRVCLARPPREHELKRLVEFYDTANEEYRQQPEKARQLATDPLGPPPAGFNNTELAAWTAVGNVLLNLDETLMRP